MGKISTGCGVLSGLEKGGWMSGPENPDLSNRLSPKKVHEKTATIEAEAPTMTVGQQ